MIHNKNGTYEVTRPRYFDKLMEKYHEEKLQQDKEKRQKRAQEKAAIKDQTTSLRRKAQLEVEESTLQQKHKQLIRPLEKKVTKGRESWTKKNERPRPRNEDSWLR